MSWQLPPRGWLGRLAVTVAVIWIASETPAGYETTADAEKAQTLVEAFLPGR